MSHVGRHSTFPEPAGASDRLEAFRGVDLHCHCLPGVDDGPQNLRESLALCRSLVADGVHTVVATPHQLGAYEGTNKAADVRTAVDRLNAELSLASIPLHVLPGGDVRIDERLPELLDRDEVLTVADAGRHVLLELPHESYIDPLPLIDMLAARGVVAVITHPERNPCVRRNLHVVCGWVEAGACLQLTAASLTGEFGGEALRAAWHLAGYSRSALVASDAHHAVHRPPRLSAACSSLSSIMGPRVAYRLCMEHPQQILAGRRLDSVNAREEVAP